MNETGGGSVHSEERHIIKCPKSNMMMPPFPPSPSILSLIGFLVYLLLLIVVVAGALRFVLKNRW